MTMTILMHNMRTHQMERFVRETREPIPYANPTLTVGEFRGSSQTRLLWSNTATMDSWVAFRRLWGDPIRVPFAFRRVGEGGHAQQSQHYAGTAFDVGQNLTNARRAQMRNLAVSSGLWGHVDPAHLTPTWVHMDRRTFPPACAAGYPLERRGSMGVYVCIIQDSLNIVQGAGLNIDGNFGPLTNAAVVRFQGNNRLTADGIVGCNTWRALMSRSVGSGFRP